ncbi:MULTISPECIES: DUF1127 domain-containing protein [Thalassobaculum]|uniref:YjiS-like domain-containing protein n=1 Tax=Thalassobaculum litoreum DSM 18839 TaxID=1123362 RepID=A0A8G2BF80_9PROT|nr:MULTISPECIES: DUF1127 domain-containing protein [Thalassobaculum]SDF17823.1 protein of unknown function [Thalassobaculum litoreum DSM 18839]
MTQRTDNPFMIAASALSEPYAALAGVAHLLAWPFRSISRAYRMRRTAMELENLDARTLRDIGIERMSINHIARASVDHPAADPRQAVTWR